MDKRSEKEIIRFYDMADLCAAARFLPFVWSETCVMDVNHVDGYPSKQLINVWRYLALQNRIGATRSGYNEHIGPERICPLQRL